MKCKLYFNLNDLEGWSHFNRKRRKKTTLLQWENIFSKETLGDIHFFSTLHNSPVDGYRRHGVDAGEHGGDGEEVVEPAVHLPEVPLSVSRVHEVDERVERRHGRVAQRQVQQEIVGHRPHPPVRQDDPGHDQVPENGHGEHGAVRQRPERDAPRRLHELVGQIPGEVGSVPFRGHSSRVPPPRPSPAPGRRTCVSARGPAGASDGRTLRAKSVTRETRRASGADAATPCHHPQRCSRGSKRVKSVHQFQPSSQNIKKKKKIC